MANEVPEEVYDFLVRNAPVEIEKREDDITIETASKVWKVSLETARKRLNRMVEDGVAEKLKYKQGHIFRELPLTTLE